MNINHMEYSDVVVTSLTPRELEVLELLRGGKSSKIIAKKMGNITVQTVNVHLHHIMQKMHIHTRDGLISFVNSCARGTLEQRCQEWLLNLPYAQNSSDLPVLSNFFIRLPKNRKHLFPWFVSIFGLVLFGCIAYKGSDLLTTYCMLPSLHADLAVPIPAKALKRTNIFKKIDVAFQNKDPIKTVVLVGIGGAGKTTLARQYVREQKKTTVVWEINAETQETLRNSFADFAFSLAESQEEKRELDHIKTIEDRQEYTKKLLHLIKRKMVVREGWFLIFDNVETLDDIGDFLPTDEMSCGKGKVLMTTRNANIADSSQIKSSQIIPIDELTLQEKEDLFVSVQEKPVIDRKKLKEFLTDLPPFPLDIEIAANCINNTNCSYEDYKYYLKVENAKLDARQTQFFKEINHNTKTRYSIITYAIEQMLSKNPEFIGLLFLVSMIDSQNIPKELLFSCKSVATVNTFLKQMKKSSLMSYQKYCNLAVGTALSMHRSTQEVILSYCKEVLSKEKREALGLVVAEALERYTEPFIIAEDTPKARAFLGHLLALSKNEEQFGILARGIINLQLGRTYYYCLSDLKNASCYSEKSLSFFQSYYQDQAHIRLARALACFGATNRMTTNDHAKGKECLEKSLALYQHYFPDYKDELACVMLELGCTYVTVDEDENKKANNIIKEGLRVYTSLYGSNHPDIALGLSYQGDVARFYGHYLKAKELYQKSWEIFKKNRCVNHPSTVWACIRLSLAYILSGQIMEAKKILESLSIIYDKNITENHVNIIWYNFCLGEVYRQLGLYEKSQPLLEKSRDVCLSYYSPVGSAWGPTVYLGQLYINLGRYKDAEILLRESVDIQTKYLNRNYVRTNWARHQLANACMELGKFSEAKLLLGQVLTKYEQHYGKDHLECGHVLCDLGHLCLLQYQYKEAEQLLGDALRIFKFYDHPDMYRCFEYLGDLYLAQNRTKKEQETLQKSVKFFTQAMMTLHKRFPKESNHVKRITEKLRKLIPEQQLEYLMF